MDWFETLMGFPEKSPQQVRENLLIDGNTLFSRINRKRIVFGELEIPSLGQLKTRLNSFNNIEGTISVKEIVANVQQLHADESNAGAVFQVASQFNLLEMVSPSVSPEDGVGIYQYDLTQGPACAVAAGAGTIYRNYFVEINGQIGQSQNNQINCLFDLGEALGNSDKDHWDYKNGYILPSQSGLSDISNFISSASETQLDQLKSLLRIGIQWNTEVTLPGCKHKVTQVYCSALPVAYLSYPLSNWHVFAQLILDAAYEATFLTAILNSLLYGNNKLYLTLVGGGAFGNKIDWIISAIKRSITLFSKFDIEVMIVSYGSPKLEMQGLLT